MSTNTRYPTITEQQFNELTSSKNKNPFMVVFTADWLGEGTIMDTIIEQLSEEYNGEFGFYRMDTDQSKDVSHQLGIRRLPTIYFFKKGEIVSRIIGMKSRRHLIEKIDDLIH